MKTKKFFARMSIVLAAAFFAQWMVAASGQEALRAGGEQFLSSFVQKAYAQKIMPVPAGIPKSRAAELTPVIHERSGSEIDATYAQYGYVVVKNTTSTKRLKVQIIKGDITYNYDLKNGKAEIYPLQFGNGSYKVRIMENTSGNRYVPLFEKMIEVQLSDSLNPFLVPNQYVMYADDWKIVAKAAELTKGKATEVEKVAAIYDFIVKNIKYDKQKAATVQSGYLPYIDETLTSKKGICFDYAALMAGMLRSQGIPTRLIIGTVSTNDINHAWNEIYLKDRGWVSVKIQFEGSVWNRADATFASSGNEGIENFIGNGSNYTGLRLY